MTTLAAAILLLQALLTPQSSGDPPYSVWSYSTAYISGMLLHLLARDLTLPAV